MGYSENIFIVKDQVCSSMYLNLFISANSNSDCSKKTKKVVGEFKEKDMGNADMARQFFKIATNKIEGQKRKIATLLRSKRRIVLPTKQ